jgi:signal transduction histidine kinase
MIPGRIYIVEDEALIAMELQDRLRSLGYEVAGTAANGEDVVREISARNVDLVLMDINLSGDMSGIEVAAWLRDNLQIGVIFLTAFSDPPLIDRARQVEPYGYLVKPYEERELHATLQMALSGRHAEVERRRLASESRALELRQLQAQKSESLRRMSAGSAHRLNNMLTVIMGNIDAANAHAHDQVRFSASIAGAKAATLRAVELSQTVRQLAERPLGGNVLDLGSICRNAIENLRLVLPPQVRFAAQIPLSGPLVYARADLIWEALLALITNAVEALDDHPGDIVLAVQTVSNEDVKRWRTYPRQWEPAAGMYACLSVSDTDRGMTDEVLGRLFDPFFSEKSLGRGLGLPLVLSVAQSAGGAVAVETLYGRGSTFRMLMPIEPSASGASI